MPAIAGVLVGLLGPFVPGVLGIGSGGIHGPGMVIGATLVAGTWSVLHALAPRLETAPSAQNRPPRSSSAWSRS